MLSSFFLDEAGRRLIVRNGHLPEQEILTGAGPSHGEEAARERSARWTPVYEPDFAVIPATEPFDRRAHSGVVSEGHLDR